MEVHCSFEGKLPRSRPTLWAGIFLLGLSGCTGFWDEVTSRDFQVKTLFVKPNPMEVLRDSTDGAKRGQALAALKEPLQHGGNREEQEFHIQILTEAATKDREPLCRLGAICALATYKDPRAAQALEAVYLQRLPFTPELNSVVRMQALASLEQAANPETRKLLITVARQPGGGTESSLADRQQTNDERLAAIRALAKFPQADAADTLVYVLETEKDIALHERAYESLKTVTGKNLPDDPVAWRNLVQQTPPGGEIAREPGMMKKLMSFTGN